MYVADSQNSRVRAIGPTGTISTLSSVASPQSLALDPDGRLLVADNDGVPRINPDGSIETVLAAGPGRYVIEGVSNAFFPSAVAVEANGDLVVASFSPKYVARFTPNGTLLGAWDDYVSPGGIALGPDGTVYLASYGFFAVERVGSTGPTAVTTFTRNSVRGVSHTFRPEGVAVGNDGTIYATTGGVGGTNDRALVAIAADGSVQALAVN